jgi:hypothetical protein
VGRGVARRPRGGGFCNRWFILSIRSTKVGTRLDFEVDGARAVGGRISELLKLRLAVCTVRCRYGSIDLGELSSVGKRWMVPVVQQALCPPVCRSLGGQALSEDGRGCYRPIPVLRFISTLVELWMFLMSLVTVGCVVAPIRAACLYDNPRHTT